MIDYKAEVTIAAPPERLFQVLAKAENYDKYTSMSGTRMISGSTVAQVGAQMESLVGEGPLKQKMVFEVTEVVPNRRMVFKTVSKGSMQWDSVFALEPQGEAATKLVNTGQIRLGGALRLMEGMVSGEIKKGEQKELERLKELVEAGQL